MVKYTRLNRHTLFCTAALVALSNLGWSQTPEELKKIEDAMPAKAPAAPQKKRHILVYSQVAGYRHASIPYAEKTFEMMGKKTGAFTVDISADPSVMTKENLAKYDAILMNNTTGELFTTGTARMALLDFVKDGKGLIGIHAATDAFYDFVPYGEMIGGYFVSHPWTAKSDPVTLKIDEPEHPVAKPFNGQPFSVQDEIYQFKEQPYSRAFNRVLTSLDTTKTKMDLPGVNRRDNDYAVSWVKPYGKDRVFYCSLGHNPHIYWDKTILEHYLAGIQVALGDLKAPVEPNKKLNEEIVRKNIEEVVTAFSTFDYGKDRAFLLKLDDNIRLAQGDRGLLNWISDKLVAVANDKNVTFASREQSYRRLGEIATPAFAGKIAVGLTDSDPKIANAACAALQLIPGPAVNQELIKAADARADEAAAGIINALGERKAGGAVDKLKKIASSNNPVLANAALISLGKIGNQNAANFLLNQAFPKETEQDHLAALANAGFHLMKDHPKLAEKLFAKVLENTSASNAARLSAYNGTLALSKTPEQEALKALFGPDDTIRTVAVGVLSRGTDKAVTNNLASLLEKESPENQIRLLGILASRNDQAALKAVTDLAAKGEGEANIAAINLTGELGDDTSVAQLVGLATKKGPVGDAAKAALLALKGSKPDTALRAALNPAGNADEQEQIITALAARKTREAAPDLIKMTKAETPAVAQAAFKALGELGNGKQAAEVLDVFVTLKNNRVLREAEKTVSILTRNLSDADQEKVLKDAFAKTSSTEQKATILKVMSRTGTQSSLDEIRKAVASSDSDLKDAGIRALAEFPDAKALDDLLAVMRGKDSEVHTVLAMRGAARLLALPSDKTDEQIIAIAKEILDSAQTDDNKIMVIGQLAELKQFGVADLLKPFLAQESLKADASAALAKIAEKSALFNPQAAGALIKEIEPNLNDAQRKSLVELEKRIANNANVILGWKYSGPYTVENPDISKLYNTVFAPEDKSKTDTKWNYITAGSDPKKIQIVDLKTLEPNSNAAVYLRAYIHSDKDQDAELHTGSDDGMRAWLNGEEIVKVNSSRAYKKANDKTTIHLKSGSNELLLKVIQGSGDWQASALLIGKDEKLPEGVSFSTEK